MRVLFDSRGKILGIQTVDPTTYSNCKKSEEYLGGLAAMQGVLKTYGTKSDSIKLDVGPEETASVSATRLWQYVLEREAEEHEKSDKKEKSWRQWQLLITVSSAVISAIVGSALVRFF
jgi:hypothetical protein